jgi:gamma-glutamyltranspeptidase / glutathione hydrolase
MRGAVAAGHLDTALAGAAVLERGGNAVDAAVAAAAASWAAEPALTAPCGGGFLLLRDGLSRRLRLLDAFTAIPGRELPRRRRLVDVDAVEVPFDEQTSQTFHIGAAACAVPGVVAGLHAAHRRFGRLPWRELLLPAAELAQRGVAVTGAQAAVFAAIRVVLTHTAEARALFCPGGRYVGEGDVVRQPELAQAIELLAARGPDALHRGALARAMVRHQHETGGRLTLADLAAYRPIWRRPLVAPYRGGSFASNPPPSSGGVLVAYTLELAAGAGVPYRPGRASSLRVLAESMRAATRLRDRRFERLLHRGGLAAHVLSPASLERGRAEVRAALTSLPTRAPALASDSGTTHISVLDAEGNAVAFTASNGCHSGVIVPGTGLHLNNMMGEEDLAAGRGLPAGTRLTSMQSPSFALDGGGALRLVLGSSGSNRLRSAVMQVVENVVAGGLGAEEAVRHPRVHAERDRLDCEGGLDPGELELLAAAGERLNRFDGLNLYFGGANVVHAPAGGGLEAAGDPRRDGAGVVL